MLNNALLFVVLILAFPTIAQAQSATAQESTSPSARAQQNHLKHIIAPPRVSYPSLAALAGASGRCDVRFDVSREGMTQNIEAECSNQVFCASAVEAIENVLFDPAAVDAGEIQDNNIIYPLIYALEGHDPERVSAMSVRPCPTSDLVS